MFFVSFSSLCSLTFFTLLIYIVFISSTVLYLIPSSSDNTKDSLSYKKSVSYIISGIDMSPIVINISIVAIFVNILWSSPVITMWFGHIILSTLQQKMIYLISSYFILSTTVFTSTSYFSSREIFDYSITTLSFKFWIIWIFCSNSVFTSIFIVEVISSLVFLLLITSTFSTSFFYRNLSMSFGHVFQTATPYAFLNSVIFFFWMSLLTSLNLFIFLLFLYTKIPTLDWYIVEYIFVYVTSISTYYDIVGIGIIWFLLLFSIFLKCGIAPVYVWKPTFFKGIPIYTLFFYISFFYFFIFLFFVYFLITYFEEIFYYYTVVNIVILLLGLMCIITVVCESYYIKVFMSISSILNSLFVILALVSKHTSDVYFWL